jgi:hypothetical protein
MNMEEKAFRWYHFFLAPFMGLIYALFLPAAGLAIVIGVIGLRVGGTISDVISRAAAFGWRPSEAYLAGMASERKRKSKASKEKVSEVSKREDSKISKREQKDE